MENKFLVGASTAAHQVEGNNIHSDFWAMENMEFSNFDEPSLDAVDHYNRYKEDIDLLSNAGLNSYRFSIEWARIEPEQGKFNAEAINHYRDVLAYCHEKNVIPVVTLHHFSSPKWLIDLGGWKNPATADYFAAYSRKVVQELGTLLHYICTINEANMGIQIAAISERFKKQAMQQQTKNIQVGLNFDPEKMIEKMKKVAEENQVLFNNPKPAIFLSELGAEGDAIIIEAHKKAKAEIKKINPELKVGMTLSLHDIQAINGGEELADKEWKEEFGHYIEHIQEDDFIGIQNYTRSVIGPEGILPVPEDAILTQMSHEFYPQALENVLRRVHKELGIPMLVTENGIGIDDDRLRVRFINEALEGVQRCIDDGLSVLGYLHWSLLDNFEWQKGYSKTFGLIAVDRKTQTRYPKPSLKVLGQFTDKFNN